MEKNLEFTHERVMPINFFKEKQLYYFHWSRYIYAKSYINRKDTVLDIACGSGYGTHELAMIAREVIGMDIDKDAVAFANQKFQSNNIDYRVGSAEDVNLLITNQVDVAVSFETIEHLTEESQKKFVAGIHKILKPDGLFIVSTPNTLIYSGGKETTNEFHLHELTPTEFKSLLEGYFDNVIIVGQRKFQGSAVKNALNIIGNFLVCLARFNFSNFRLNGDIGQQLGDFEFSNINVENAPFLVAICRKNQ